MTRAVPDHVPVDSVPCGHSVAFAPIVSRVNGGSFTGSVGVRT